MALEEKRIFLNYLKEKGFSRTRQRQMILDKFLELEGHVCTDELYRAVRKQYPRIGYATVFRCLKLLQEAKLASEVNFTGKRMRFEHEYAHPHHDHLICTNCGKTIEFASREVEEAQRRALAKLNFLPLRHRLEIFGYCRNCSKKRTVA